MLGLCLGLWAAASAVDNPVLGFHNPRAVWDATAAHIAVDCVDPKEIAGRPACDFGEICCALLPDTLDDAVSVSPAPGLTAMPEPFVTTATRNGLRVDGPFVPGAYTITVRTTLRTQQGTALATPYHGQVQVPPRPPVGGFEEHATVMAPPDLARVAVVRGVGGNVHLRVFRVPAAQLAAWAAGVDRTTITGDLELLWEDTLQGPWDAAGVQRVDVASHVRGPRAGVWILEATADGRRDAFFTRITPWNLQAHLHAEGGVVARVLSANAGGGEAGITVTLYAEPGDPNPVASAVTDAAGEVRLPGAGARVPSLLVASRGEMITYLRLTSREGGGAPAGLVLGTQRARAGEALAVLVLERAVAPGAPGWADRLVVRDSAGTEVGHVALAPSDGASKAGGARWLSVPLAPTARPGTAHVALHAGDKWLAETALTLEADSAVGMVRLEDVPTEVSRRATLPVQVRAPTPDGHVQVECYARPGAAARAWAAVTSFQGARLGRWQWLGQGTARLDAEGRAQVRCPAVSSLPMMAGEGELLVVAEVHGPDGTRVGRTDARVRVVPPEPPLELDVDRAGVAGPVHVVGRGIPCGAVQITGDAVWMEHAWDYERGHETFAWQPRRSRLGVAKIRAHDGTFRWEGAAGTAAVRAACVVPPAVPGHAVGTWVLPDAAAQPAPITVAIPTQVAPGSVLPLTVYGPPGIPVALVVSAEAAPEARDADLERAIGKVGLGVRTVRLGDDEGPVRMEPWRYVPPLQAWEDPWLPPGTRWLGMHVLAGVASDGNGTVSVPLAVPPVSSALHIRAFAMSGEGITAARCSAWVR